MVEAKGRGRDFLSRRWHDHSTQSLRTPAGRAAGCGHCDGDALDLHRDDPFLRISHRVVTRRDAAKQSADDAADPKVDNSFSPWRLPRSSLISQAANMFLSLFP